MRFLASVPVLAVFVLFGAGRPAAATPVLVLHFDEDRGTTAFNTAPGGDHGTLHNGTLRTAGVFGNAVQFDGIDGYVAVPHSSDFYSSDGFTIETWIRIDSEMNVDGNNNWRYLLNKPGSIDLIMEQSRHVGYSLNVGGTRYRWWPGQYLTNIGQWYHTAWSYEPDTGTMRAYLNGAERTNTLAVTGPMTVSTSDLRISWPSGTANPVGSGSLPGTLDGFAFYTGVLSGTEILARYNGGPPEPKPPTADRIVFHFDEGAGNVARNAVAPRHDGSILDGATWADGVYGSAIHFDGIDGHVRAPLPAAESPTSGLTVEGWFYLDQNPNVDGNNNWRWIFNKGGWASPFDCILEQDRGLNFSLKLDGDPAHYRFRPSGARLPLNEWTHAAWTYDGDTGTMAIYLNGTPYVHSIGTTGNLATNDLDLFLSWPRGTPAPSGNGAFPGRMDEFALYGYALTADQIMMRYSSGSPLGPFHWIAADGSYADTAGWQGGAVPSGSDNAVIVQGVSNSNSLEVAGTGSLTVSRDGTLNNTGVLRVGAAGAAGTMYQYGGSVQTSSDFYVADGGSSGSTYTINDGTLTVNGTHTVVGRYGVGHFLQNGGEVNLRRLFVAEFAGSAGSTYTLNDGTLNIAGSDGTGIDVGRHEAATFNQNGGSISIGHRLTLGRNAGAQGTYNMTDGSLTIGGWFILGENGTGTFNQSGGSIHQTDNRLILGDHGGSQGTYNMSGGTLTTPELIIADKTNTSGSFSVSGDGVLNVGGDYLIVGRQGPAHFQQSGESEVNVNVSERLLIADMAGSGGSTYTISGGTLNINNGKEMSIGKGGSAVFTQSGGTVNASGNIRLGEGANSGTYQLQGGILTADTIVRGTGGSFEFTGGTLHVGTFGSAGQPFTLDQQGGILAPGNSIGTTSVYGDYNQAAAGILEIEIAGTGVGGTDYDLVEVYGNASLAGELDIVLLEGFEAELGNYFDVLTTTGSLAIGGLEVTGHPPNPTFGWWDLSIRAGANDGAVLRLTAVPEPSGAILALLAVAVMLMGVRRRG